MSRLSGDELATDGTILNGFDYNVQVWVINGIIKTCGHPAKMRLFAGDVACCNAWTYADYPIHDVPGHEVRDSARS